MKRTLWMRACLAAGALALGASGVLADDEHGAAEHDPMMEAWMKAAAPGEPHAFLARMAGEWKTVTTHHGMGGEEGETTEGTASFQPILGGRAVQGRYTGTMWGQPFEGMSLDGYDNVTGKYWSVWLDNTGTALYVTHGTLHEDGQTLEHSGTMAMPDGNEAAMRFVTTCDGDDRATMLGYMTMGSEEETHTMTIEYTRVGS